MKFTKKLTNLSMTQIMNALIQKQTSRKLSVKLEEKYQGKERTKTLRNFQLKRKLLQRK